MAEEYAYTLVSPAGNEHHTNDETYRYRLLSQGYTEKTPRPEAEDVPRTQAAQPEVPAVEEPPAGPPAGDRPGRGPRGER